MTETRFSAEVVDIFTKAVNTTKITEAISILAVLPWITIEESKKTSRWDSKTGKPLNHEWIPSESWWNGRVGVVVLKEYIDKPAERRLGRVLEDSIKTFLGEGALIVDTPLGTTVVTLSDPEEGGRWVCFHRGIKLQE